MMRILFLFLVSFTLLFAKTSTDKQIKNTNQKLYSYNKNYANINKKMAKNARDILEQKHSLVQQSKSLSKLKKELQSKEKNHKSNIEKLQEIKLSQKSLHLEQNSLEEKLVFVIAKSVSLSIILDEAESKSENSLIEFEVLKAMLYKSKQKASRLSAKFSKYAQEIETLDKKTLNLDLAIKNIENKKKKLMHIQKKKKRGLIALTKSKKSYTKKLKNLIKRQNSLKKTLSNLHLVKIDEIKKIKQAKERKKAFTKKTILLNEKLPDVKKHGSSYQAVKTKKYRGKKTISPIDSYTITKKYGTYTDPIYGIKIFNESISLQPKHVDAKVKTVFNGKVIYAEKTAVLNNIVIVEHANGLNTIYANLSQISPNIKKGLKIKKGYTIGRVSDELIFEVTQKSYHINPIRLFKN